MRTHKERVHHAANILMFGHQDGGCDPCEPEDLSREQLELIVRDVRACIDQNRLSDHVYGEVITPQWDSLRALMGSVWYDNQLAASKENRWENSDG